VDDEASIRESLSSLIRSVGFTTKEYVSAEDFLTWGWWDEPACLILDVRLPAMSGLELQRYLAESQSGRPIVFISGNASENEETWAMMKGAVAFLRKPFTDESLLHAVRQSVACGSARQDLDFGVSCNRVCPLCRESARAAETPRALIVDNIDLHASAVEMIKRLNPEWSEQDGLCHRCWQFYVGLGRVVDFFVRSPAEVPQEASENSDLSAGIARKGHS
jgi:CheY-like chemotaxis protein